jgi:hypothetical protein
LIIFKYIFSSFFLGDTFETNHVSNKLGKGANDEQFYEESDTQSEGWNVG